MPYKDIAAQREYQRLWIANRRAQWFADKHCKKCKKTTNLELDHIIPGEKVSHRIWSWSWKRIMLETAKCQVLCHDCHWEKTKEDMDYKLVHGTVNGYDNYKCRCEPCRAAKSDYKRKMYEQKVLKPKTAWGPYYAQLEAN